MALVTLHYIFQNMHRSHTDRRHTLVYKLLGKQISAWQMAGFTLANLLGMAIILIAVQFYVDVIPLLTGNDSFMKPEQIVVNKRVNMARTLTASPQVFRKSEIEELREQPFVEDLALFTPSRYGVYATIGNKLLGMQYSTEMFFESIPNEYIDVDLSEWSYTPGDSIVPIILPHNYLNLYNFGFATSRGLPTISEGTVKKIGIQLFLQGNKGQKHLLGRVVGFSRRLNTILVPQPFMDTMNEELTTKNVQDNTYENNEKTSASRLVVRVKNLADENITKYLQEHNYDTEGNDADASRAATFFRIIVVLVMVIGLVICTLAFYLLLLSIFLLLQKHTEKIDNLLLIGHSPSDVARPFHLLALGINALVLVLAVVLTVLSRSYYLPMFGDLSPKYEAAGIVPSTIVGLVLFALMAVLNFSAIRRKVLSIWDMHKN